MIRLIEKKIKMKKAFVLFVAIFTLTLIFLTVSPKAEAYSYRVRGYYRSSGTYVQPYYRTSPNRIRYDNYSYKYNYNPYTGRYGTRY